jgi:hypothetical protein
MMSAAQVPGNAQFVLVLGTPDAAWATQAIQSN